MPKSKVMELAIKIAGKVDKSLGTSTKAANKQLATIQKAANKVSTVMTAGLAAMGSGAIAATKYLSDLGGEWKTATNQVASATGAAGKELEGLRDVMEDVYAANFGDSVADVGDAVAMVNRNMADLDQEGLTRATEGALALRDAFEYDVAESTRAAEAIRKNFGGSAEEAFSLIAAGAQNGLDYSGELIDTINEYSSQFAKLGFDADGMFNILQSGADSTAWNLDKVGDAIKEFSIRAIDGSDGTVAAFKDLGYNVEEIMETFAAGGEGANKAFFDVINTLMDVDDQVKRDALGVALFGTMWEDLGVEAMEAMAGASQAAYDTEGALEQINQVKYNDLDSAIQGIGRQFEVALLPAADAVYQSLMDNMPEITEAMEEVSPVVAEIAEDFADWAGGAISEGLPVLVDGIRDFADWAGEAYEKAKPFLDFLWEHKGTVLAVAAGLRILGPAIGAVTTAMSMYSKAKWFMALLQASGKITQITGAFKKLGSILIGPVGIILVLIGLFALLWKNWDTAKAAMENFGQKASEVWTNFKTMVDGAIASIGEKFPLLGAFLTGWWESIQEAVEHVKAIFQNIIEFFDNVFSGDWGAAWENIVAIFENLIGMIVDIAKAPVNGVISVVEGLINRVIDGINGLITGFSNVLGVAADFLGIDWGGIDTLAPVELPRLAEGGVATSPTLAEIGEGGEPEAVMPLSKLAAMLDEWTKPKPGGGDPHQEDGDGETIVFSPVFNFYGKADREDVEEATRISFQEFKRLYKKLKAEERRKNFKPEPVTG